MLFSSMIFLWVFLPIVLICNFLVNLFKFKNNQTKILIKNTLLLVLSLTFYAWGGIYYLLLMLASIFINYFGALIMERVAKTPSARKWALAVTVIANLGMLFFFKYFNMTVAVIEAIMGPLPEGQSILDAIINMKGTGRLGLPYIVLPIGISFFTFQAMSYSVDVYRGNAKLQTNIFSFALYISLFPQLIAGPIVRYSDVALELEDRRESLDLMVSGIKRFCYGMGKKVLLSNTFAVIADKIWALDTSTIGSAVAWYGLGAYTLQLYYDFSGYSDMAIGIGRMLGFHFKENFDYPYTATSVQDFWKRWHISLTTWFKEYVYIPLGGNRKGLKRQIFNILVVWMLTGLWHGASWNFVVWGLYFGLILVLEKAFLLKFFAKIPAAFAHIYSILLIVFGWVIFECGSMGEIINYFRSMFGVGVSFWSNDTTYILCNTLLLFAVAAVCSTQLGKVVKAKLSVRFKNGYWECAIVAALLLLSLVFLAGDSYNPFLYFRF